MNILLFIAALTITCASAQIHISQYVPINEPLYSVTSSEPRTWLEMRTQCNTEHPGYFLSMQFDNLPPDVVALCPKGNLVPLAIIKTGKTFVWDNEGDLRNQTLPKNVIKKLNLDKVPIKGPYAGLLWPGTELRMVGNETKFTCAVCEMSRRLDVLTQGVYPPHENTDYAYDLELVSYDRVKDIGLVANGSDLVNKLLGDLAEAFNISVAALRWHGASLNADQKAVVDVYHDSMDFDMSWFYYVHWNDEFIEHKTVKNFEITMIKLSTECYVEKEFLSNVMRESYKTGSLDVAMVEGTNSTKFCNPDFPILRLVATRECHWDVAEDAAVWSNWVSWCPTWEKSDGGPGAVLTEIFRLKGDAFRKALKNFDVMVVYQFEYQLDGRLPIFPLKVIVPLANTLILLHTKETPYATTLDMLSYSIPILLAETYMQLSIYQNQRTELSHSTLCNVLVSDLDYKDPVVGLALSLSDGSESTQVSVSQINYSNMTLPPKSSHVVMTVSDSIAFSAKRVAFATYGAHLDSPNNTWRYDFAASGWMAVVQVTFTRDNTDAVDLDKDYLDIAFKPVFHLPTLRGMCAERNFTSDGWFSGNCRILKSMRDDMLVCRCTNLFRQDNITTNMYIIYGYDTSFSNYLGKNKTLIVVMVFVSIMSAFGLLSVVLTAILFPEWRDDQGHKIFLQMTSALTVNLVLGFVNNFISIDTKTVACIVIGVFRHYSFLAMFFWMMVLSGLQMKRLMTIAGAKATTHLILKVSLIAWGLPLIPIVVLLAWDTGFYKSQVSNRGYCYPEDVAFQATVQGPAGIILIANLVVFVIILNHIYGWVKCNKDAVVRKHTTDDRAAQLRNLGNSVFVFFLFGFTWTFHFLSEEGIINSEFLFEFLFLITASFHLFMLSLFFVVLDKKTSALWMKAFGKESKT